MLILSECISQFDLLETAIGVKTLRFLGLTEDVIVLQELVELVQLFLGVEWDLDNLVNEEENKGEGEDDVGVEGDEFTNCILISSILAVIGAVPYNPVGLETRVRDVLSSLVNIAYVSSTIVFLIII